jgi:hypothetical protein
MMEIIKYNVITARRTFIAHNRGRHCEGPF